jgi:hypothetical protein
MQPGTSPPHVQSQAAPDPSGAVPVSLPARLPYEPPVLERLGPWEAFTLRQSVPIFP